MPDARPFERLLDAAKRGDCTMCTACQSACAEEGPGAIDVSSGSVVVDAALCTDCRACLAACPVLAEAEPREESADPLGPVLEASMMTTGLARVRFGGASSGVVTSLLLHLLETEVVSGVVLPSGQGLWESRHVLAKTADEVLAAMGNRVGKLTTIAVGPGRVANLAILPSLRTLHAADPDGGPWAVVALPCEMLTIHRMRAEGVEPASRVKFVIGLFCFTNLLGHADGLRRLEEATGIRLGDLASVRFGGTVRLANRQGESREITLEEALQNGPANCRRCADAAARAADISVGAVGAWQGFSTVLARSRPGVAVLREAWRAGFLRTPEDLFVDAPASDEARGRLVREVHGLVERKWTAITA